MNSALTAAATAMEDGKFAAAIEQYTRIMRDQPEHAGLCASQIGAAHFFLHDYDAAIEWYRRAGEHGFAAEMIADNIREAEAARAAAGAPSDVGAVVRGAIAAHPSKSVLVPPLPPKKLRNVRGELPASLREAEILALVDLTLFGSAKNAIVLTANELVYVDGAKTWSFAWTELRGEAAAKSSFNTITVDLASGPRELHASTAAADLATILDAIAQGLTPVTKGGSRVLRHTAHAAPTDTVAHADDERLVEHLEEYLGESAMVWHEIVSDRIHLDIHVFPPDDDRDYYVLVTSGASALPMTMPADVDAPDRIELCMLLPADWPLDEKAFKDDRNYWPIRVLKQLGRLPHDLSSWLGTGHSIPNGDPAKPYAGDAPYAGVVLLPPVELPDGIELLEDEPQIALLQVLPITPREMDLKLQLGMGALYKRFQEECPERFGALSRTPRVLR